MVCAFTYCGAGGGCAVACCYSPMKGDLKMLSGNDYQAIQQIIRDEMKNYENPKFLKRKLKESQHEANSLSAQVCTKEKQLQQIRELLGSAEWLDEDQELLTISLDNYNKMLDIICGGII